MTVCRTCLTTPADKDIFELEKDIKDSNRSYIEIMMFCLDIKITRNSRITTNLCQGCYEKIISFYEFKELCSKNDAYLNSLGSESPTHIKNEICTDSEDFSSNCDEAEIAFKQELDIKQEDALSELQLDTKRENNAEATEKNAHIPKRKGRLKKTKVVTENGKNNGFQVCEECGKSFRDLKTHSQCHLPKAERTRVPCKECSKTFSSFSARYKHHKTMHLGIKKQCDICEKEVTNLKQHKLVVHNSKELPYECVSCGQRFISPSALADHMTKHTKDTPYECDQCDKKFKIKIRLQLHKRRIHDKERSHLCQFCSKAFFLKDHLLVHLRSHTKEKPYECTTCGKFFTSSTTLKHHQITHGGEKPHKCEVCSASFSKPGYLKAHMIKHTRERPHPCAYCGLGFGRSDHRRRHELTAHENHLG